MEGIKRHVDTVLLLLNGGLAVLSFMDLIKGILAIISFLFAIIISLPKVEKVIREYYQKYFGKKDV